MNPINEYAPSGVATIPVAIVIGMPSNVTNMLPATSSTAVFGEPANDDGFQAA